MNETNEEITQNLKEAICDYYMGLIKQKFKGLLANGKEAEISSNILQFLDAQIDTGNSTIIKDDIVRILNAVLEAEANLEQELIPYCFPATADIKIENGEAAYLTEKITDPLSGVKENSCYLYISPDYYNNNIVKIEEEIKKLEKTFSKKDLKDFEEKYEKDLSIKKYELESAKVYESATNQIEMKKEKFISISQKLINEYGRKYEEIAAKEIPEEEKEELKQNLLNETKSYDEKTNQAVLRLNTEYETLVQNFQGKVENAENLYKQMQNLHLFDKNRYFEDMKASVNPKLRDLYKKRYLLNSYRINHNEPVYNGNQNILSDLVSNILKKFKVTNTPLMLGPHFERDLPSYNESAQNTDEIDKNLVKALAAFYSNNVVENKFEFEDYLTGYFKKHYKNLVGSNSDKFLNEFSKNSQDENGINFEEGDLYKIAKYFEINPSDLQLQVQAELVVKDGLIYENSTKGLNIIYATNKALTGITQGLYGENLYHKHLADENNKIANNVANLQNNFINYAKQNGIELENNFANKSYKKRFIKRKTNIDNQSNVVDFKQG